VYLRSNGAEVTVSEDADRSSFRRAVGISDEVASCHTGEAAGYFFEGHVPAEPIAKLLVTRPAAIGLTLPAMPSDSPGMGGDPASWARQPVLLIQRDGTTTNWTY
jgi:hypothetical protein